MAAGSAVEATAEEEEVVAGSAAEGWAEEEVVAGSAAEVAD